MDPISAEKDPPESQSQGLPGKNHGAFQAENGSKES